MSVNHDYDKELLEENTNNLINLTYKFLNLDKVATEEEDVKSSLGSLKLMERRIDT